MGLMVYVRQDVRNEIWNYIYLFCYYGYTLYVVSDGC